MLDLSPWRFKFIFMTGLLWRHLIYCIINLFYCSMKDGGNDFASLLVTCARVMNDGIITSVLNSQNTFDYG